MGLSPKLHIRPQFIHISSTRLDAYTLHTFNFQLLYNKTDVVLPSVYRDDMKVVDYTNFIYYNKVFFNVCFPRRVKGYFNFLRPFG
jgi:hypothetical protein